jgi:hypothetical protein
MRGMDKVRLFIGACIFIILIVVIIAGFSLSSTTPKNFKSSFGILPEYKKDQLWGQAIVKVHELWTVNDSVNDFLEKKRAPTKEEAVQLIKSAIKLLRLNKELNQPDFVFDEKTSFEFLAKPVSDGNLELTFYAFILMNAKRENYEHQLILVRNWLRGILDPFVKHVNSQNSAEGADAALFLFFDKIRTAKEDLAELLE